jgi:hypothetical protein
VSVFWYGGFYFCIVVYQADDHMSVNLDELLRNHHKNILANHNVDIKADSEDNGRLPNISLE